MLEDFITLKEIIPAPYTSTWKVLHDYTDFLRKHPQTKVETVDPRFSYPEIHNFYAYCKLKGYAENIIYPLMLLNNLEDPMNFTPEITELIVPDAGVVASILSTIVDD